MNNEEKIKNHTYPPQERLMLEWKDKVAICIAVVKVILPWGMIIGLIYFLLLLIYDCIIPVQI
jgi:hypothetical protein